MDKACFQHDMAYGKYKDLKKRRQSDKVLKDKAFEIANNPKYDGYQIGLANELHKPIIRKFKKIKVYSSFKDNIWGADLADTQLISKYNKGIRYLLCAFDLFSKYAFIVPLKEKKGTIVINAFQIILDNSKRKSNKIWVDQGSEF